MNIAIKSIIGYEYQYKVAFLITLVIGLVKNVGIYIKNPLGEDIVKKSSKKILKTIFI
jgi:hypothetical protein